MWEILLTRLFTLLTLSAGDVKDSARAQTGFIALRVLRYEASRASVVNVSKLNMWSQRQDEREDSPGDPGNQTPPPWSAVSFTSIGS